VALIRRGEVWVVRLNPNQGTEVGKVRPVVVPLTSQRRRGAEALRVSIRPRDRLLRECWAMAEQPRALDRSRLGEGPLTLLSGPEMEALEQALRAAMGLAALATESGTAAGSCCWLVTRAMASASAAHNTGACMVFLQPQTAQISSRSSARPSASSAASRRLTFTSRSAIPGWPARQISTACSWGRLDAP